MRSAAVATGLALAMLPMAAFAQGRDRGAILAEHWCMGCHLVEPETRGAPADRAPSFASIAAKPGTTTQSIGRYLSSGHTHMPDFRLSPDERDDLVNYILSLRTRR